MNYPENDTTTVATYSITDPDGDALTWSIAGTDAARFSINEDGELSFRSSPNYEAPNDANTDNVYEVTVRASDSDLMSTLDVEVTITDANESGAITGPASVNYPENSTTTVATYSITDPDGDDSDLERRRHGRSAILHQFVRRTDIQIVTGLRSPERRQHRQHL